MRRITFLLSLALAVSACSKEEDNKVSYNTKLRSTGKASVALHALLTENLLTVNSMTANSAVNLEYLKVPISRINLTAGDNGTGYTDASPDFYSCSGTAAECAVNLLDSSLDTLLSGSSSGEMKIDSEKTYTGVAVEHCSGTDTSTQTYDITMKGSVTLGGTTYYTNNADGLSTTGPAEETAITVSCSGSNSKLVEPVTLSTDGSIGLVFYTDPSANVFATSGMANSNCKGNAVKICSNNIMIFGTVDSAKPTVERYLLDTDGNYSDVLVSILFNQADKPFGALMSEFYTDTAKEQLLHTPTMAFSKVADDGGGKYSLQYGPVGSPTTAVSNFQRANHTGSLDELVTEPTSYQATKL